MITRHTYKSITWIDLASPTRDEVREVMETYDIDALIADELLLPTARPRVDVRDAYLYLILHFPSLRHTHGSGTEQELDIILGKDFLITTRYETIDPLLKFAQVIEMNETLQREGLGDHAGVIFFYMIKKMYKAADHEIEFIRDALEDIEENIYKGQEKEMVITISKVGRDVLNLKQSLDPHQEVLKSFEESAVSFFGTEYQQYARSLVDSYYRVRRHVTRLSETLTELRETNNSLLTTKQNEVMKIFTILAFVTFPLSLIASIFGMNTTYIPLVGTPIDFWYVMFIMGAATFIMFMFFKSKNWL